MKPKINILVTSSGGDHVPSIIERMQSSCHFDIKIIAIDLNPNCVAAEIADMFFSVPNPAEEQFVGKVYDICKQQRVRYLLPLSDEEAEALAKFRDLFCSINVHLIAPSYEKIKLCNDKFELIQQLAKLGIDTPIAFKPRSICEIKESLEALDFPKKNVVIKPVSGRGGRGVRILTPNFDEWEYLTTTKKEVHISKQRFDTLVKTSFERLKAIPEMIIMEFLEGDDYNCEATLNFKGKNVFFAHRRLAPFFGPVQRSDRMYFEEVEKECKNVSELLGLTGLVNIEGAFQSKIEPKGFKVYEINPRMGAGIMATDNGTTFLPEICIADQEKIDLGEYKAPIGRYIRSWRDFTFAP